MEHPAPSDRALIDDCPKAQTLHRLLGARRGPGGILTAARDPLPFRAVIVDESSMIDLVLMDRLLAALPSSAMLVLLGTRISFLPSRWVPCFETCTDSPCDSSAGLRADVARPEGKRIADLAVAVRVGEIEEATQLCVARADPTALLWQGVEQLPPEQRDDSCANTTGAISAARTWLPWLTTPMRKKAGSLPRRTPDVWMTWPLSWPLRASWPLPADAPPASSAAMPSCTICTEAGRGSCPASRS